MRQLEREQRWALTELAADPQDGTVRGVAAAYNVKVDRGWGLFLRLLPGSFAEQLRDPARVKLLFHHQWENPIGRIRDLTDTKTQLRVSGQILAHDDRPLARQVLADLRDGLVDEFSVGFEMLKWRVIEEKNDDGSMSYIYEVSRARLREISVVTFGAMGDKARIQSVNSVGQDPGLRAARAAQLRAQLARCNH